MIVEPGIRGDDAGIGHTVEVLPPDRIQAEGLADTSLGLGALVVPVIAHRLPKDLLETGFIAVAVLGDDRRYRFRICKSQPPADRSAVVVDVHGVPGHSELGQEALRQIGQRVKALVRRWSVRQAEPEMIRSDYAVSVGQLGDEVAEHE